MIPWQCYYAAALREASIGREADERDARRMFDRADELRFSVRPAPGPRPAVERRIIEAATEAALEVYGMGLACGRQCGIKT